MSVMLAPGWRTSDVVEEYDDCSLIVTIPVREVATSKNLSWLTATFPFTDVAMVFDDNVADDEMEGRDVTTVVGVGENDCTTFVGLFVTLFSTGVLDVVIPPMHAAFCEYEMDEIALAEFVVVLRTTGAVTGKLIPFTKVLGTGESLMPLRVSPTKMSYWWSDGPSALSETHFP